MGKEISYMSRYETQDISMMNVDAIEVLYIPGGHGCLLDVNVNEIVHQKILEAYHKDKILAAVCHGTSAFAFVKDNGTSIVSGKKLTGFPDFLDTILLSMDWVHKDFLPLPYSNEQKLKEAGAIVSPWNIFFSIINPLYHITDYPFVTGVGPKSAEGVARKVVKLLTKAEEEKNYQTQPTFA